SILPSRFIRVVVECAPADSGCFSAGIVLRSDGGSDTVTVTGCAIDTASPIIYGLLWFGGVPIGQCADRTINLYNGGDTAVVLRSLIGLSPGNPFILLTVIPPEGITILPGEFVPLSFRFCPTMAGLTSTVIDLVTSSTIFELSLFGTGGLPQIVVDPAEIDFGDVPFGSHRDSSFMIHNRTTFPVTLSGQSFGLPVFSSVPPLQPRIVIPAGDSAAVRVRFTPDAPGSDYTGIDTLQGIGPAYVLLHGQSPAHVPKSWTIWLDSNMAHVGGIARLRLRIQPPPGPGDSVSGLRISLRYDSTALFLDSVVSAISGVAVEHPSDGVAVLTIGPGVVAVKGSDLAALDFLGLATGHEINSVVIDSVSGLPAGDTVKRGNGRVLLEGCIIGHVPGLGLKIAIHAVRLDPDGSVAVDYAAPAGSRGVVRVVSAAGRELLRRSLEEGTGEEAHVRFSLAGLPGGFYFVSLVAAGDQSVVPMLLSR
ncbi:MAG: choice-of-anchor D domain-containing protein, partial [Bacteroidota bacterium]